MPAVIMKVHAPTLNRASERPPPRENVGTVLHVRKRTDWKRTEFFRWLDQARVRAGYAHDSALADASGVSHSTLSNWRNGKTKPTTGNLTKLARCFDVEALWVWKLAGLVPDDVEAPRAGTTRAVNVTSEDLENAELTLRDEVERRLFAIDEIPLEERWQFILMRRARIAAERIYGQRHA